MFVLIYHNPQCSKSRQTLALLQEQGVEPAIIEYLKDPPTTATLRNMLSKLGLPVRAILRETQKEYQEMGLDDQTLSDEQLFAALQAEPILMQRPIVLTHDKAAIGRPPEKVLDIL